MKNLKLLLVILVALILVVTPLMATACEEEAPPPAGDEEPPAFEEMTLRIAHVYPPGQPPHTYVEEAAAAILERTGDKVTLEIYPAGSLYDPFSAVTACQEGALDFTIGGWNETFMSPGLDFMTGLPFLWSDRAHLERFVKTDAYRQVVIEDMEAKGILEIAWIGNVHFANFWNFVHPVETLEDFAGLKMKMAPVPLAARASDLLGIAGTLISPEEVTTAIETGVVDGGCDSYCALPLYGWPPFPEHIYITIVPYLPSIMRFVASKKAWDSLSPELQQIIREEFEIAAQKYRDYCAEEEETLLAQFEAMPDVTISYVTQAEMDSWIAMLEPLYEEVKADPVAEIIIEGAESVR